MREKSCMTRNLIFLFIGLLLIYMLQKNGNFFPVFFLISSLFLIYRNRKEKRKVDKIDVLIGILLAILSLNPIYAICIGLGYVGAKQVFDNSSYKINLCPKDKKEVIFYGIIPATFLILLNTIWFLQTVSINVGFRLEAITGSLIACIPEELLYRYLVFALCVILCNNQIRTKSQKFLCYLILIVPHVLMHFPAGVDMSFIDVVLMSIFGIILTRIQMKSSLLLAIIVHFLIDFFRIIIFGV